MKPKSGLKVPRNRKDELIVFLDITSYKGWSIGEHFTGTLKCEENEPVYLTKVLSALEAAVFRRRDPDFGWKEGDTTSRMRDKAEILQTALAEWRNHFPDAKVLIEGNHAFAEPQPVLDGLAPEQMEYLNGIYHECKALGWWDGGHEDKVRKLDRAWDQALEEYMKEE